VNYVIHLNNSVTFFNIKEFTFVVEFKSLILSKMINPIASSMPLEYSQLIPTEKIEKCKRIVKNRLNNNFTDIAIIDGIKIRDNGVYNYLYNKFYKQIRYMVTANSGTKMDAEDLFQDALIVVYQNFSKASLILISSFYTYFYSICWHLWLQKLNKLSFQYQYIEMSDQDAWEDEKRMNEITEESKRYQLFQEHFFRLNQADQKLLRLYINKISVKEIASLMGYNSGNYVKLRKYICKEKLKKSITNDPRFLLLCQS